MTLTVTSPTSTAQPERAGPIRQLAGGRYDGGDTVADMLATAGALAQAGDALPEMYRGNPGNILATMYRARALDIPIAVALEQLFFDHRGKGGMPGSLMLGLILRAGHRVQVIEASDRRAEMALHRCDGQPSGRAAWSITDAALARLLDNPMWTQYPEDMLYWRAVARLARRYAADVVQGFGHLPEELAEQAAADDQAAIVRDVDVETMRFLADVDLLDAAALRALWMKANTSGLGSRYAGDVDDVPYTVSQLLLSLIDQRRASAPAGVAMTTLASDDSRGMLACGCRAADVIQTGDHIAPCPQQANTTQANPSDEPAVDDSCDVFGPALLDPAATALTQSWTLPSWPPADEDGDQS